MTEKYVADTPILNRTTHHGKIRRLLVRVVLGFGLVLTIAWGIAAQRFASRVYSEIALAERGDFNIRYDELQVGGFPWHLVAETKNPQISAAFAARSLSLWWQAPILRIEWDPWRPHRLQLRTAGEQHFILNDAGEISQGALDAKKTRLTVPLSDHGDLTAELKLSQLVLKMVGEDRMTADTFITKIRLVDSKASKHGGAEITVDRLREVSDDIMWREPISTHMMLHWAGALAENVSDLNQWRLAGGAVEVDHCNMNSGVIEASCEGRLTLDPQFRPTGDLAIRLTGYDSLVDRMSAAGLIAGDDEHWARMCLHGMADPEDERDAPPITLSLKAQNGGLFMAWMKLLELDPLPVKKT